MNRIVTLTFRGSPYALLAIRKALRALAAASRAAFLCLAPYLVLSCCVSAQTIGTPSAKVYQLSARLYARSSFWNISIPAGASVDPASSAMVAASIVPYASRSVFANGERWGVPAAIATSADRLVTVRCLRYCTFPAVAFRVPAGARASTGSDHHLAVLDGVRELDLWDASFDASRNAWSAATVVVNDASGWGASCPTGRHCNGAVAAGFALLGGLIWPQEIRSGHIHHALALTLPRTRAGIVACPATHTDGKIADPTAIPEGSRIQLDPAFNIDAQTWPAWEKAIAHALQEYGAYVVDTGGRLAIRGVADVNLGDNSWASAATPTQAGLSELPWDRVRVLQSPSCN